MRISALALAAMLVLGVLATTPAGAQAGTNIEPVYNLPFPHAGAEGTDSDFITYDIDPDPDVEDIRTIGIFGSIGSGAWLLDVSEGVELSAEAQKINFFSCGIGQGDIQTFQQGERTFFTFADDGYSRAGDSDCIVWGQTDEVFSSSNKQGTFIVDITDPHEMEIVDFVPFALGSHNQTVHPSGNFLYNSNSELITNAPNAGIEIWEITNLGTDEPINHGVFPLPIRPGLGTDSHDITFNTDGSRAYSAALSQTVIINTEDPANPVQVSSFIDPAINVEHQANPVTVTDPILGERDFLIVEDEFAGAAGAEQTCPSGGTHVYDITDELELAPVKVGSWYVSDVTNTNAAGGLTSCTAHVFDIHEESAIMTMSFYGGGVKVIDLTGLVGVSLGANGVGMKEIGSHSFPDSNSWSVKTPHVTEDEDGTLSMTLYSDDINRGIDVYEFEGSRAELPSSAGEWFPGTSFFQLNGAAELPSDYTPRCLLKGRTIFDAVSDLSIF